MKRVLWGLAAAILIAGESSAEVPHVVVDIAPMHALAARVMQGVGAPDLLIPSVVSPHDYAMRPSEARALQAADVVFWTGHALIPSLEHKLETVAPDARRVELMDIAGLTVLPFRETAVFGAAHDGDDEEGHDEEGHEESGHGHDHAHGGADPHVWLDPENARVVMTAMADVLAEADPEHGDVYHDNATAAGVEMQDLMTEVAAILAPVHDRRFVVFHDAYHYFENRFGLEATGSILMSDAAAPSGARLRDIRDAMAARNVVCVFTEPQFNPKIVQAVAEAGQVKTAELDPIGVTLPTGAALYPDLIRGLAQAMAGCLRP